MADHEGRRARLGLRSAGRTLPAHLHSPSAAATPRHFQPPAPRHAGSTAAHSPQCCAAAARASTAVAAAAVPGSLRAPVQHHPSAAPRRPACTTRWRRASTVSPHFWHAQQPAAPPLNQPPMRAAACAAAMPKHGVSSPRALAAPIAPMAARAAMLHSQPREPAESPPFHSLVSRRRAANIRPLPALPALIPPIPASLAVAGWPATPPSASRLCFADAAEQVGALSRSSSPRYQARELFSPRSPTASFVAGN